jgi:serine/threonine protein kinase
MRCLNCHRDGLDPAVKTCPGCSLYFPSLPLIPSGTLLRSGAYRIEYALGWGGFGITYQALHVTLNRPVAIKEFYPQEYALRDAGGNVRVSRENQEAHRRALERFLEEGQLLAQLDHPGVVRVYDCFAERETAYLVMELLEGLTLEQELDSLPGRTLPPPRTRAILEQLVAALEAVHEEGVYHLDLKPANILLNGSRAVLVDFGAARQQIGGRHTQAFTLEYAPLEVILNEEVGPESDLFELGMMLHEMLTGERPPPALSRIHGDTWTPSALPAPWNNLVASALRLQRSDRPPTVRAWWGAEADTGPATLHVGQTGRARFRTIGAALEAASPGDRILIRPGLYSESLLLEKSVQLLGRGKPEEVIVQSDDGNCLLIRADAAVVRGLTLRGRTGSKTACVAVDIAGGRPVLEDCDISSDSLSCVAIRGETTAPILRRCTIHDGADSGLFFLDGARGLVEGCTITGHAGAAVAIKDGANPVFRDCTIGGSRGSAVLVYREGAGLLERCTVQDNQLAGLEVRSGGEPVVRGCTIRTSHENGVLVHDDGGGLLEDCTITANTLSGVESRTGGEPVLRRCRLMENAGYGVCVHDGGSGSFEKNDFAGNVRGAWYVADDVSVQRADNHEA